MASEIIHCPSCEHAVRVPDTLFGKRVRCPECKAYFKAPLPDAEGRMGAAELLDEPPPRVDVDDDDDFGYQRRSPVSRSALQVPGLFLLLVGLIGTFVNGFTAISFAANPDMAEAAIKNYAKLTKQEVPPNAVKDNVVLLNAIFIVVAMCSIITIIGAVAMLRARFWTLAFIGSILAMVNFGNLCCLIGLPAGIYCIIKLLDPDVKALFARSA